VKTMILAQRARRTLTILAVSAWIGASLSAAFGQEISESHLKAARAAVAAIKATDLYDGILPAAAAALKQSLIEKNPDMQQLITDTVDQKAFELAARRADLEKEAAMAYAKLISEADLTAIAAFYNSDAGKSLLANGPLVTRELNKAADIWQNGIARDLATEVSKVLASSAPKPSPAPEEATPPAEGAAPAEGEAQPAN